VWSISSDSSRYVQLVVVIGESRCVFFASVCCPVFGAVQETRFPYSGSGFESLQSNTGRSRGLGCTLRARESWRASGV
jgi:hypothetical protein